MRCFADLRTAMNKGLTVRVISHFNGTARFQLAIVDCSNLLKMRLVLESAGDGKAPMRANTILPSGDTQCLPASAELPCGGGPANGTSKSPSNAAQASRAQASLMLIANAAFSTIGRT